MIEMKKKSLTGIKKQIKQPVPRFSYPNIKAIEPKINLE